MGNNANFVLALRSAGAMTFVSLLTCIGLAIGNVEGPFADELFGMCSTTWQMGFGAIIGLVGGKRLVDTPPK